MCAAIPSNVTCFGVDGEPVLDKDGVSTLDKKL